MDEADFTLGNRRAWLTMLSECVRHLGYEATDAKRASWITEREEAIQTLRRICSSHGDNEWDEDLHLSDIIEKHLCRHLDQ